MTGSKVFNDVMAGSKVFNDPIHGNIELHPLCVRVIDTPQFQRLRFLKQVGFAYFIFPAASHNRFEHSIGVCHLAGQFARMLKERQPELQITEQDVLCVEIAGLCHDLGHGPFSHLWEEFVNKARPGMRWKHENSSVSMLDYLIRENNLENDFEKYNLGSRDLTFIKELIVARRVDSDSEWPYEGRPRDKSFLYQIVCNDENGVDVDKWDYFMRDGHSLGLQVTFNHNRLMRFSRVINVSESEVPKFQICFRDKEVTNLYQMFHARMTLHRTAYQHRVVKIIDTMLLDAFMLAKEHVTFQTESGNELPLHEVVDEPEMMTYLNDSVFHRIHYNFHPDEGMRRARTIIHNILTRNYYPYVGHTMPTTKEASPNDFLAALMENLPPDSALKEDDLAVHLVSLNYGDEDRNPVLRINFYSKAEPDRFRQLRQEEISTMLPLRWQERIFRVVCRVYDNGLVEEASTAFAKACKVLEIPRGEPGGQKLS